MFKESIETSVNKRVEELEDNLFSILNKRFDDLAKEVNKVKERQDFLDRQLCEAFDTIGYERAQKEKLQEIFFEYSGLIGKNHGAPEVVQRNEMVSINKGVSASRLRYQLEEEARIKAARLHEQEIDNRLKQKEDEIAEQIKKQNQEKSNASS